MEMYLAIDIGASSGRHILGWLEEGTLRTEEVYRFPNGVQEQDGHLVWDIGALEKHVKTGVDLALEKCPGLVSLAIDTWGVDYVLLENGVPKLPVYAYRDKRTEESVAWVHEVLPFETLYGATGCQFQSFNTLYQLAWDQRMGRLNAETDLMMLPEYLLYTLCGNTMREYTNATTTGMVNAKTGRYDPKIIRAMGFPGEMFGPLSRPGTFVGTYRGVKCLLCATHDTASAVEGIPMEGNQPYISSGTWSLLGVKTAQPLTDDRSRLANYSNEGGVGYNRYQKNIMGMWLVNELRRELCPQLPFEQITQLARESACTALVDANSPAFLAPKSMKAAFDGALGGPLPGLGDYFRCAYRSLAQSYRQALEELEQNTGEHYTQLYIVGGGAKNGFLNDLTAQATGKEVIALPIEATALGNLKIQMTV